MVLTRWGPIQPSVLPQGQAAPPADGSVGLKRTRGSAGAVLTGRVYRVVARGNSRRHGQICWRMAVTRRGAAGCQRHPVCHQPHKEPSIARGQEAWIARTEKTSRARSGPCQRIRVCRSISSRNCGSSAMPRVAAGRMSGPSLAKRHGSSRLSRQGVSDGRDYSCTRAGRGEDPCCGSDTGRFPGVETAPDQAGGLVPVLWAHFARENKPVGRAMECHATAS